MKFDRPSTGNGTLSADTLVIVDGFFSVTYFLGLSVEIGESSMDTEAVAEARARAQRALSRARLATDPELQREWRTLAESLLVALKELEAANGAPAAPVIAPVIEPAE